MTIEVAQAIIWTIQTRYPGGQRAFEDEGGTLSTIPIPGGEPLSVWIFHPDLSPEFVDILKQVLDGLKATGMPTTLHVVDTPAFEFNDTLMLMNEIGAYIHREDKAALAEYLSMSPPDPSILVFSFMKGNIRKDDPIAKEFLATLKEMPFINRALILTMDGCITYNKEVGVETQPSAIDVNKLHDMLAEDMDVQDFIDNL